MSLVAYTNAGAGGWLTLKCKPLKNTLVFYDLSFNDSYLLQDGQNETYENNSTRGATIHFSVKLPG